MILCITDVISNGSEDHWINVSTACSMCSDNKSALEHLPVKYAAPLRYIQYFVALYAHLP